MANLIYNPYTNRYELPKIQYQRGGYIPPIIQSRNISGEFSDDLGQLASAPPTVSPNQLALASDVPNTPVTPQDTGQGAATAVGAVGAFGGMAGDVLQQAAPGALGTIGGAGLKGAATGAAMGSVVPGLGTAAGAAIGGALGTVKGAALGTIGGAGLKGAATGAAMGSVVPGLGTAAGAAIGGALGTVKGAFEHRANVEAETAAAKAANAANIQKDVAKFQNSQGMYEQGGNLNSITEYNGPQHEQGGIALGNTGNEVQGKETRGTGVTKDFIFSDDIKLKGSKITVAAESKKIEKKYKGMENDRFAEEAKNIELADLAERQERHKQEQFIKGMQKLQQENPEMFQQMMQQQAQQQQQAAQQQQQMQQQVPPEQMQQEQMMQQQQQQQVPPEQQQQFQDGGELTNTDEIRRRALSKMTPEEYNRMYEQYDFLKRSDQRDRTNILNSQYTPAFGNQGLQNLPQGFVPEGYQLAPQLGRTPKYGVNPPVINSFANGGDLNDIPGLKAQLIEAVNNNDSEAAARIGNELTKRGWTRQIGRTKEEIAALNEQIGQYENKPGGIAPLLRGDPGAAEMMLNKRRKEQLERKTERLGELEENIQFQNGGQLLPDEDPRALEYEDKVSRYVAKHQKVGELLSPKRADALRAQYMKANPYVANPAPAKVLPGSKYRQARKNIDMKYNVNLAKALAGQFTPNKHYGTANQYIDQPAVQQFIKDYKKDIPVDYSGIALQGYPIPNPIRQEPANLVPEQEFKCGGKMKFAGGGKMKYQHGGGFDPNANIPAPENINQYNEQRVLNSLRTPNRAGLSQFEPVSPYTRAPLINPTAGISGYNTPVVNNNVPQPGGAVTNEFVNPITPDDYRQDTQIGRALTRENEANLEYTPTTPTTPEYSTLYDITSDEYNPVEGTLNMGYRPEGYTGEYYNRLATQRGTSFAQAPTYDYLTKNLQVDPQTSQALTADPQLMQGYFDHIQKDPQFIDQQYERAKTKGFKGSRDYFVKQAFGDKRRFGQFHHWMLDSDKINEYMTGRERQQPGEMTMGQREQRDIPVQDVGGGTGEGSPTKPFVGDYVTAGLSTLPNIASGIGMGILGNRLDYGRAQAEQADPNFVDPTRLIQETRDQYAGVKDTVRQASRGAGKEMLI